MNLTIKPFSLFALLALLSFSSKNYAQYNGCAITTLDVMNVMYVGVENPVTVHVNNFPIEEVSLEMENSTIKASKGNSHYMIRINKEGTYKLLIYHKDPKNSTKNLISSQTIRAKNIPSPQLSLAGIALGSYSINIRDLRSIAGITCIYSNFDFPLNAAVESFDITMISSLGKRFKLNNQSSSFSPQTKMLLNSCKAGDIIIFSNIIAGEKITGKMFHCNALSYLVQ